MILRCSYSGCGIVCGEKEALADKIITRGFSSKHFELAGEELRAHMDIQTS